MKEIIEYLDNYLTRAARPNIDPVDANAILAKAGILRDSNNRLGKPLRDLLRKGKLPHAFQSGGKGSVWLIPISNQQKIKTVRQESFKTKIEHTTNLSKPVQVSISGTSILEKLLMAENNFKSAFIIDNVVPHNSGLYCIRITDTNKLPKPFNFLLANKKHNIIYIGIASQSLNKRFLYQELRANGHGTFFRSIGAILGHRPPKGSLVNKANKRNYKFSSADEQKIIQWINDNLIVNWIDFSGDFEALESELINKYRPLINLAKNPEALQELSNLRKLCVEIANTQ